MNNLLGERDSTFAASPAGATAMGFDLDRLASRLDSLILVLKSCKGQTCVRPWEALHPLGDVATLSDALSPRFDDFYEVQQRRVAFSRCELGQMLASEGPQFETDGAVYRRGTPWHEWV